MINIVHFSRTPSAGSPIRLVQALKKYSDFNISLIDLHRFNIFPEDIIFNEDLDKALELTNKADIIHFHHYIDLDTNEFHPINFKELKDNGTLFLRQYRTNPKFTAKSASVNIKEIYDKSIPTIVVGQYMERFYPTAFVVPNIIPENDSLYIPSTNRNEGIYFAPTFKHSAWTHRWETKAAPEVMKILNLLKKEINAKIISLNNKPLNDALKIKQGSEIVIDDLITGSYHISSLEGLSMGKPVLSYLDERTKFILSELSGSNECPFVNVRLEEAYEILSFLLDNKNIIKEIGKSSRKWIEKYWSEKILIRQYVKLYEDLLDNPEKIRRQKNLQINDTKDHFFAIVQPDIIYRSRANKYFKSSNLFEKINIIIKKNFHNFKNYIRKLLGSI